MRLGALVHSARMLQYVVDELNSDRVAGWAFDPEAPPKVTILVDGEPVGLAQLGGFRIDVARALGNARRIKLRIESDSTRVTSKGFLGLQRESLCALATRKSRLPPYRVVANLTTETVSGPLPPEVLTLLSRYSPRSEASTSGMNNSPVPLSLILAFFWHTGQEQFRACTATSPYRPALDTGRFVERYFPARTTLRLPTTRTVPAFRTLHWRSSRSPRIS